MFADFHLHSKYARASSKEMNITSLSRYAKLKGINLLGTGDFTHPKQLAEIKEKLQPIDNTGLYTYNGVYFMLTTEMATFYYWEKKLRRVHHLIHVPNIEIVDQIIDVLTRKGANTGIDGRMAIKISSAELVETLMEISKQIEVVPAHVWTPFFGCLGSKTGFDSVEECYLDETKNIHAIETGLSSNPPMNWRLSSLDKFTLMSNSDSHSPWPWRLGRECNVFELKKLSYEEIMDAVRKKDKKRFLFTIEVDPAYGKYHWTGHRKCNVLLSPKQALKLGNKCPVCGNELTIGVEQRVEELADRPEGFIPKDAIPFRNLIPLSELIKTVFHVDSLYSKTVWREFENLIRVFGNEFNVLLYAPRSELEKVTKRRLVDLIMMNRDGKIRIIPGYDGVYGRPVFDESEFKRFEEQQKNIKMSVQKTLQDFKKGL